MRFLFILSAFLLSHISFGYSDSISEKIRSSIEIPVGSTLILGTSAQPPTFAHGMILSKVQKILDVDKLVLAPARPYKKGIEKGAVALELSQVATSHFDEVLNFEGTLFRSFSQTSSFSSQFRSESGKQIEVSTSPVEYLHDEEKDEDPLYFLKKYREVYGRGNANQVFWISGMDSFISVPSWTSEWKELFDQANWVIVSRAGYENRVNLKKDNPLLGLNPNSDWDKWITQSFDYERLGEDTHLYRSKLSHHPGLLVLNLSLPDISSTQVRTHLRDHSYQKLNTLIQPSVLRAVIQNRYYEGLNLSGAR